MPPSKSFHRDALVVRARARVNADVRPLVDAVVALTQWIWAPVVACSISCVYFLKADALPLPRRIMVSAHGSLLSLLYVGALFVYTVGMSKPFLAYPFWVAFVVPLASAALAFAWIRDKGALHALLLLLAACAAWSLFIGTMAVTGEWL